MARITSPICKKCRRAGTKLFIKGERCFSAKCAFIRRSYGPGPHGMSRKRSTEYGKRLVEKQKAKNIYGVLEKQFRKYYDMSNRGENKGSMILLIERRLDNVVFRAGMAESRRDARQIVSHGHILVNGKRVNIPSYQVKVGDVISLKSASTEAAKEIKSNLKRTNPVSWVKTNADELRAEVTSFPHKEDVGDEIDERLIIEYYSR